MLDKELLEAVNEGDNIKVKELLEKGANVNAKKISGATALHFAVDQIDISIMEMLLDKNPNVNAKKFLGTTALHLAVKQANVLMVEKLLKKGADINARNILGVTALEIAVRKGYTNLVDILLAKSVHAGAKNIFGSTVLHYAVKLEDGSVLKMLLEKDVDINANNLLCKTPLYLAVKFSKIPAVEMLLSKNVNVNCRDILSITPLHIAAEKGDISILEMLLAHGADVNVQRVFKMTALHLAARNGHLQVVESLLAKKAEINPKNFFGSDAVKLANDNKHKKVVELLLAHGAYLREQVIEDTISSVQENSEIISLKEQKQWFIGIGDESCESVSYYDDKEFIVKLSQDIVDGKYKKNSNIMVYSKSQDGKWLQTKISLFDFTKNHFKLRVLYEPVKAHAMVGVKWGIIVGVVLKLCDTFIALASVDIGAALLFLVAIVVCFIPKIGIPGVVIISIAMSRYSRANFFMMSLSAAVTGAALGCLPGMGIAGVIGIIRRKSFSRAKDVMLESKNEVLKFSLLPLITGSVLIVFYLFIFNPWLMKNLD